MRKLILVTSLFIQITNLFAQGANFENSQLAEYLLEPIKTDSNDIMCSASLNLAKSDIEEIYPMVNEVVHFSIGNYNNYNNLFSGSNTSTSNGYDFNGNLGTSLLTNNHLVNSYSLSLNLEIPTTEKEPFFRNRRNVYSSLWTFASFNYLYADLVGLMDKNKLNQYQTGVVDGVKITPQFLTAAAAFMQIPLSNVFLPHVIKNDKTLRWVQIASGSIMTLVQAGTLFIGKPAPYYTLFSVFEIAATTYITIDAIKWKTKK